MDITPTGGKKLGLVCSFLLLFGYVAFSVSLRYGYYGDRRMLLGPNSSRLVVANSVFVDQVEVRENGRKEVVVYGFDEKPELSRETNWTVSSYLIVGPYGRKGFTLWLNKGSKIHMHWEAHTSHLNHLELYMIKGERNYETVTPNFTSSAETGLLEESINGKEAEYTIEEHDKYYVGFVNTNFRSIIMSVSINVSSKTYDLTKVRKACSTSSGSCQLKLSFPNTRYVLLTTPHNVNLGEDWDIDLSFIARIITYIAILGFIVIIIFLILKYLGVCDGENETHVEDQYDPPPMQSVQQPTERQPIMADKSASKTYGTNDEDDDGASSSSSEELYDAKLCVICYDEQRNCFFVPCGHCATCYECAQRIMEGESKVCPICRRLIHKVRRLFRP